MILLKKIELAFAGREYPKQIIPVGAPPTDEYQDALAFEGKHFGDLDCDFLERHPSGMFAFTQEAFCYFLPDILSAGIKENRPELMIYSSIIGALDRSNTPKSWDIGFVNRWGALKKHECAACQEWLLWLSEFGGLFVFGNELSRAFDTLTILSNQLKATPLARK